MKTWKERAKDYGVAGVCCAATLFLLGLLLGQHPGRFVAVVERVEALVEMVELNQKHRFESVDARLSAIELERRLENEIRELSEKLNALRLEQEKER